MKAYKGFTPNPDGTLQCRDKTYRVGETCTEPEGVASAAGVQGAASATGYRGVASATGDWGAASATGEFAIAHADGYGSKARGALGCALTLTEWDASGTLVGIAAVIVGREHDGVEIQADTWYELADGVVREVVR